MIVVVVGPMSRFIPASEGPWQNFTARYGAVPTHCVRITASARSRPVVNSRPAVIFCRHQAGVGFWPAGHGTSACSLAKPYRVHNEPCKANPCRLTAHVYTVRPVSLVQSRLSPCKIPGVARLSWRHGDVIELVAMRHHVSQNETITVLLQGRVKQSLKHLWTSLITTTW